MPPVRAASRLAAHAGPTGSAAARELADRVQRADHELT